MMKCCYPGCDAAVVFTKDDKSICAEAERRPPVRYFGLGVPRSLLARISHWRVPCGHETDI
jgi:hypothetical protein